jgi:meso-butanediol dehydrogenase/(S,S)-butanediol dehydrogenase/diacetyl reductase
MADQYAGPGVTVAVVTGGGRGIGRGIALALAADGFDLVIGYSSNHDQAASTAAEVAALGRRVDIVDGDVAYAGTSKLLLDAAVALGKLGAWINNAGVSVLAPVVDTAPADLHRMLDVNVGGVFHGLQAAARWFMHDGSPGRIVNISSDLGVQGTANLGAYAATKFAVVGLTQSAAVELASRGITVNAVCPGTAETDMVLAERATEVELSGATEEVARAAALAAIPAGRFCTPEDVGGLVAWLCGPAGSYVTGQALCVNGGSVLH